MSPRESHDNFLKELNDRAGNVCVNTSAESVQRFFFSVGCVREDVAAVEGLSLDDVKELQGDLLAWAVKVAERKNRNENEVI